MSHRRGFFFRGACHAASVRLFRQRLRWLRWCPRLMRPARQAPGPPPARTARSRTMARGAGQAPLAPAIPSQPATQVAAAAPGDAGGHRPADPPGRGDSPGRILPTLRLQAPGHKGNEACYLPATPEPGPPGSPAQPPPQHASTPQQPRHAAPHPGKAAPAEHRRRQAREPAGPRPRTGGKAMIGSRRPRQKSHETASVSAERSRGNARSREPRPFQPHGPAITASRQ